MGCVIEDDQNGQLVFNVAPRLLLIDAHGGIMLLLKSIYTKQNKLSTSKERETRRQETNFIPLYCGIRFRSLHAGSCGVVSIVCTKRIIWLSYFLRLSDCG